MKKANKQNGGQERGKDGYKAERGQDHAGTRASERGVDRFFRQRVGRHNPVQNPMMSRADIKIRKVGKL